MIVSVVCITILVRLAFLKHKSLKVTMSNAAPSIVRK